jgi:hypothetical protein
MSRGLNLMVGVDNVDGDDDDDDDGHSENCRYKMVLPSGENGTKFIEKRDCKKEIGNRINI